MLAPGGDRRYKARIGARMIPRPDPWKVDGPDVTTSKAATNPETGVVAPVRPTKIKRLAGTRLGDLVATGTGDTLAYVSVGPDPRMILCDAETGACLRLGKGSYRFVFQARVAKGRLYKARLYLNTGKGFSEAENDCVFLAQGAPDIWYADICAKRRIVEIRFDPSEAPVSFTLTGLVLEEWGTATLSAGERIYGFLRASYRSLPRPLTRPGPIARAAELAARALFGRVRRGLRERERAATGSVRLSCARI